VARVLKANGKAVNVNRVRPSPPKRGISRDRKVWDHTNSGTGKRTAGKGGGKGGKKVGGLGERGAVSKRTHSVEGKSKRGRCEKRVPGRAPRGTRSLPAKYRHGLRVNRGGGDVIFRRIITSSAKRKSRRR